MIVSQRHQINTTSYVLWWFMKKNEIFKSFNKNKKDIYRHKIGFLVAFIH